MLVLWKSNWKVTAVTRWIDILELHSRVCATLRLLSVYNIIASVKLVIEYKIQHVVEKY